MNISKKSGSYRCIDRLEPFLGTPRYSLCGYFWQAFSAINIHIMVPVGLVLAPMVALLNVNVLVFNDPAGVFQVFCVLYIMLATLMGGIIWLAIAILSAVMGMGAIFWCLGELGKATISKYRQTIYRQVGEEYCSEEPPPCIIVEYIKAKHKKVCPLITYTED